jgi:general secretion pathway protein N
MQRSHQQAFYQRANRPPWSWAGAGALLGLVVVVLLQAPASWLTSAINQASAGKVVLTEARGTVWKGSARLLLSGGTGSRDLSALPDRMNWRLRPTWTGLSIRLGADCCTPEPVAMVVSPRWGGARIQVLDSTASPPRPMVWPAALLAGLGAPWNTLQVDGQLSLLTQGLSVEWVEGRLSVAGRAELLATGMSSRLSTIKPMGSYRITLDGGNTATLEITTLEGSLQLAGTGQWIGSRLRFEGVASATPEREAALSNLLNILGRRTGARSIITVG